MAIHHARRGSGEPLLLIQGMSGHSLHWGEPFLTELERDFELITIDNRGTGDSPRVDAPFSIAELADDASGVLDELGIESAHVLGISMGGMIAQELTLRHPDKVRTLTLGCTYAGGPEGRLTSPEVVGLLTEAMQSGDRERAVRVGWGVNVSEAFAADESNYETFREAALTKPVAVQVIMLKRQAIMGHDTSSRLGEITAPTLVIHGTEDQMLDVSNGEAIARAIPGARFERLEGVGHMFWIEQPQRSAELIREHALAGAGAAQ
jgi:pimeloyl-ACP methyl ester carboxylesterase